MEVSAALVFFAIFAAAITALIGSATSSRIAVSQQADLVQAVTDAAQRITDQPIDTLLADTFTIPAPCDVNETTGSGAASCLTIKQRTHVVDWTVDVTATEADQAAVVTVTGTFTTPLGSTRTATWSTTAALSDYSDGQALLRVAIIDGNDLITGETLYLLNATNEVVASAPISPGGVAIIRTQASSCPVDTGCAISASPTGWGQPNSENVALTGPAARGGITLQNDQLTPAVAAAARSSALRVILGARNASGTFATPDVPGSVCLWVTVTDDARDTQFPVCNTDDAKQLTIDSYPTGATASSTMVLTANSTVTLNVDSSDGDCPTIDGQLGATANNWQPAAVCTSWTWGTPNVQHVSNEGTAVFGTPITLGDTPSDVTVVWQGSQARPAAGYAGQTPWTWPRTLGALQPSNCWQNATCQPVPTAPETDECPGEHCNSARNPAPSLVTSDTFTRVATNGSEPVEFTIISVGNGETLIAAANLPEFGTLEIETTPENDLEQEPVWEVVTSSQLLAAGEPATANLRYTPTSTSDLDTARFTVTSPSGTRTVPLFLYTGNPIVNVTLVPGETFTTVNQTARLGVYTIGVDGNPTSGAVSVNAAEPSGAVTTSNTGWATLPVTYTQPGQRTLSTVTAGGASSTQIVTSALSSTITVIASSTATDAATLPVAVTVTDAGGNLVGGAAVQFKAYRLDDTNPATFTPTWCVTNSSGACTVSVTTNGTGRLVIQAVTGNTAGTHSLEVS